MIKLKNTFKHFWKIPRKPNRKKHKASLLDLFFDLVIVTFIGGSTHKLVHTFEYGSHFSTFSFMVTILPLFTILLIWRNYTFFSYKYESIHSIRHRFFTFIIMLGLLFTTVNQFLDLGHEFQNLFLSSVLNIAGFLTTLLTLFYLYLSGYYLSKDKYEKKALLKNVYGLLSLFILWSPSLVVALLNKINPHVPMTYSFVFTFWIIGLISWSLFDWLSRSTKITINKHTGSVDYLQERFGIIFIVFIGEAIIQIVSSSSQNFIVSPTKSSFILIASFLLLFMWWTFFNDTINYPDLIKKPTTINLYSYVLLFLLLSLTLASVGLSLIIKTPENMNGKIFLGTSMIIWQTATAIIFKCMKNFKSSNKTVIPKSLRIIIYTTPLTIWTYIWTVFTPFVSSESFLLLSIIIGISFTFIIWIYSSLQLYRSNNGDTSEYKKEVDKFKSKNKEWMLKVSKKYGDYDYHKINNFELNNLSKIIEKNRQ